MKLGRPYPIDFLFMRFEKLVNFVVLTMEPGIT